MKLTLKISLFLFFLITFGDRSFSLTDYEIKKICKKEKRELTCQNKLKEKRLKLQKGTFIEIPVIPFKK